MMIAFSALPDDLEVPCNLRKLRSIKIHECIQHDTLYLEDPHRACDEGDFGTVKTNSRLLRFTFLSCGGFCNELYGPPLTALSCRNRDIGFSTSDVGPVFTSAIITVPLVAM